MPLRRRFDVFAVIARRLHFKFERVEQCPRWLANGVRSEVLDSTSFRPSSARAGDEASTCDVDGVGAFDVLMITSEPSSAGAGGEASTYDVGVIGVFEAFEAFVTKHCCTLSANSHCGSAAARTPA